MAYDAREMCDMILLYGETHGNAAEALRLYRERYPNRRHPHNPRFILGAVQRVRENRPIVPSNPERAMDGIMSVALEERVLEHKRYITKGDIEGVVCIRLGRATHADLRDVLFSIGRAAVQLRDLFCGDGELKTDFELSRAEDFCSR